MNLRDREVACSASDCQCFNVESFDWRTVSSHSSHHPREVLLAQFSLYVHKRGLKPHLFHFYPILLKQAQTTNRCFYCWINQGSGQTLYMVGGLGIKNAIFILQPCFYTQNTQFSMFFATVVVGGVSECWVRPPSSAHRDQNHDQWHRPCFNIKQTYWVLGYQDMRINKKPSPEPVFSYKLRYIVGFGSRDGHLDQTEAYDIS